MPTLLRAPSREYRVWVIDSRRWAGYRPRDDDIVITTYPKCGTTWMQRLVSMLVFASAEPRSIHDVSPWPDARMRDPLETMLARAEAQTHRRFFKSHVPLDGLPIYDGVAYIHVARDGRDAFMSWHNHQLAYTAQQLETLDRIGLADETIARPYPRAPQDPGAFFRSWVRADNCAPGIDYFAFQATSWPDRTRANVLFVHYNDLTSDLDAELRRIAAFLGIDIPETIWPHIVAAGGFEAMRRDGQRLLPNAGAMFMGGADRFLFKGRNGRWRDVLAAEDLDLYAAALDRQVPPACARWLQSGRAGAGDPRTL